MTATAAVTIDGPAGAGKTTVGRQLAAALGRPLLDTGLLYRALAVIARRRGVGPQDRDAAAHLARTLAITVATEAHPAPGAALVRVDGEDITWALWDEDQAERLSGLAALPAVRAALLEPQRRLGEGAVVVGRDAGSVVFPDAPCKLYLDASPEVRAARRAAELRGRDAATDPARVGRGVQVRDRLDRSRALAPLAVPAGAHVIATDGLTVGEVLAAALAACRAHGLGG